MNVTNVLSMIVSCFVTLIVTLFLVDIRVVFEPTTLLPLLNTLFLGIIPCFSAYTAARLYMSVGNLPLLMIGSGMLAFGTGGLVAGWFIGSAGGPNITITIYNCGALFCATLLLLGKIILHLVPQWNPFINRVSSLLAAYLTVAFISSALIVAAVTGHTPPFILQGIGPTSTGKTVLITAIVCFAASAALCVQQFLQCRTELLRWFAAGQTLLAVGLTGVLLQKYVGSPIGWVGRGAQYAGAICILFGVMSFWRKKLSNDQSLSATFDLFAQKRISELEQLIITLQQTQVELNDSRSLLNSVITGTSDAVYVKDLQGRYLLFNPAAEGFVGMSATDVLGKDDFALFPPTEAESVMAGDRKVIEAGVVSSYEEFLTDATGKDVTFLSTKGPLLGLHGQTVGLFGIARDITERKQLQVALQRSKEELATAQTISHVGSWRVTFGEEGEHWSGSAELCRIFGYPPEMMLSMQTGVDRMHSDDREAVNDAWAAATKENGPLEWEHRIIVNGQTKWLHVRTQFVFDEEAHLIEAYGVTQDISERKQSEMALANLTNELEKKVTERTESLSRSNAHLQEELHERTRMEANLLDYQHRLEAMSLELSLAEDRERGRIAGELHDQVGQHLILGKMKLHALMSELSDEDQAAMAEDIDLLLSASIQDIRSLTFQLRPPILANVGLEAAIQWLGEDLRESYGLQTEFFADLQPKPLRYEIRTTIFQVVRELLLNVIKHANSLNATINMLRDENNLSIEIIDHGRGFDPTVNNPRKHGTGGFGLFNVQKKVEYLGGQLNVDTERDKGTRVTLRVPLDIEE